MSVVLKLFPLFGSIKTARRVVRLVIGFTLLVVGVVLIVLPGPAFVVIPFSLAILAGEVVWARILLRRVRHYIDILHKERGSPHPED